MTAANILVTESCNCMALRRAARRVSQFYDDALSSTGLRSTQFTTLSALQKGPLSVNELAQVLALDRTTTGKNLRPLEVAGLIVVAPSEDDLRRRKATLTAQGRVKLKSAYPLWQQAQATFERVNGAKPLADLRAHLGKLRTSA